LQLRTKTSYEEFPIYLNFKNDLAMDETVSSIVVACVNTATGVSSSIVASSSFTAAGRVTLNLDAGVDKEEHKATVTATTSFGQIYEQEVYIAINDEAISGSFGIQPNEGILAAFDFANTIPSEETIDTHTMTAIKTSDASDATATVIKGSSITGTKITFKIDDCTAGEVYKVIIKINTNTAKKYQRDIMVSCKEN